MTRAFLDYLLLRIFGLSFAALKHEWLPLGKWIELEKGKCSMLMVAQMSSGEGGLMHCQNFFG